MKRIQRNDIYAFPLVAFKSKSILFIETNGRFSQVTGSRSFNFLFIFNWWDYNKVWQSKAQSLRVLYIFFTEWHSTWILFKMLKQWQFETVYDVIRRKNWTIGNRTLQGGIAWKFVHNLCNWAIFEKKMHLKTSLRKCINIATTLLSIDFYRHTLLRASWYCTIKILSIIVRLKYF